ncbi:hypothetical protein MMC30_001734 [Trapelia coarctata]|nr:hypothetical protein [Trapelia coarctata]
MGDDLTTPEPIDLATPEPEHDEGSSNIPNLPITDPITPESARPVDLRIPEPGYGEGSPNIQNPPSVDLVTPELVPLVDLPLQSTSTESPDNMSEPAEVPPVKLTDVTIDENPAALLGSDSWNGADAYVVGDEFHERATTFFAAVKWDVLASLSSSLRNGIPCDFGERFSIGHFNLVRQIVFADGVSWVARLRLPQLKAVFSNLEALDNASVLKVEIASMKFLKAKTSIPVPEVYSYSVDPTNDVGALYILMDYINGTVATELQIAKSCDAGLFGTADQDRRFRQQMAGIQVELSSFKFDQIGSLYQDEKISDFFIGPDIETGKGPWTSSMDYYNDLANHALQVCVADAAPDVQTSCSFAIPILFKHLISLYGYNNRGGPFSLTNRDFGAHNLLVNDDFEIIGVIDFDGVMAAPIEVVAQLPQLTRLDREPPGHVETRPFAIDRIKRTEPKLKEYKNLVEMAELRMGSSKKGEVTIANIMLLDATSVFQGLRRYASHQKFVNDKWMDAYLRLVREHVKCKEPPVP